MIIVYGEASSGKSNIAENMAVEISNNKGASLVYLATMESETKAAKERIRKHRIAREGKGFYTIEEPYRLVTHVFSVREKVVLLECVSNYCANTYFKKYGDKVISDLEISEMTEEIVSGILKIDASSCELIVVSNDIFRDGIVYDEWTEKYQKLLAHVNEELASRCDKFYEVVNGIAYEIS